MSSKFRGSKRAINISYRGEILLIAFRKITYAYALEDASSLVSKNIGVDNLIIVCFVPLDIISLGRY